MSAPKIVPEVAAAEVQKWCELFDVEIDVSSRAVIERGVVYGRIGFDEEKETFTVTLRRPLELANGSILTEIELREPTTEQLRTASRGIDPEKESMEVLVRIVSAVSGHPLGVIGRIGSKDISLMGVVVNFFS